jgi:hypothetical protein
MNKIIVRENDNRGKYDALYKGEILCRSTTPLLTAARILAARGLTGRIEMWREGSSAPAITSTVDFASGIDVQPSPQGTPRFRRFIAPASPPHMFVHAAE